MKFRKYIHVYKNQLKKSSPHLQIKIEPITFFITYTTSSPTQEHYNTKHTIQHKKKIKNITTDNSAQNTKRIDSGVASA